jgi:uncharacterized protein (TIGR02996 family)
MNLRVPFLADVRGNPGDDAPRLIYADWLEDNGDPQRAEFIRVQCELAKVEDDDPRRNELLDREQRLLDECRPRWLAELPAGLCPADDYRPAFRRGFPRSLDVPLKAFLESGDRLFESTAWETIQFQNLDEVQAWRLSRSPHLRQLRRIDLSDECPVEVFSALLTALRKANVEELAVGCRKNKTAVAEMIAAWPGAKSLHRLSLYSAGGGPDGMAALARSPHLGKLTAFAHSGYNNGGLGAKGVTTLVRSDLLAGLTELELPHNNLRPRGFDTLLRSPKLANLRTLVLSGNASRDGLDALGDAPLNSLRKLDLSDCGIDSDGAGRIADAANLTSLRWLSLDKNPIETEGMRRLASSPHLAGLLTLQMQECRLGDDALAALAASPHLRPRELTLRRNPLEGETVGAAGWLALAGSPVLGNVATIDVHFSPVGDAFVAALVANRRVTEVRKLDLLKCRLSDDSALAISRAKWRWLRYLSLSTNAITDAGGLAVVKSPLMAGLRELSLGSTQIGDATAIALAKSTASRSLVDLYLGHSRIGDDGARALASSPNFPRLRRLNVWHNQITRTGLEALWARFGDNVYPQRKQLDGM